MASLPGQDWFIPAVLFGLAAYILFQFVRLHLVTLRMHEIDMRNWGDLSDDDEAELDRADKSLTRLYWLAGFTSIATLIWVLRDRIFTTTTV